MAENKKLVTVNHLQMALVGVKNALNALDGVYAPISTAFAPLVATAYDEMVNVAAIYVYVGAADPTHPQLENGCWYFWNPNFNVWDKGGIYNSTAFASDKTLSVGGDAADARTVGERFKLLSEVIPNTAQNYTFVDNQVSQIEHVGLDQIVVRTDTFSYDDNAITETRTLASGESLTIVTDLTTLETVITHTPAA